MRKIRHSDTGSVDKEAAKATAIAQYAARDILKGDGRRRKRLLQAKKLGRCAAFSLHRVSLQTEDLAARGPCSPDHAHADGSHVRLQIFFPLA